MLTAQFRLSDEKKLNSADGKMNKPTTNIYFPFFSVPHHLILHGKISGLGEIRAWKFGVLIFSPRIFLVSSGIRQVFEGKTAW